MERIFEPRTEQEFELVKTIKTNQDKAKRKKALQQLLILNGFDKNDLYAIRSIEVYSKIPNKPSYCRRFYSATVVYNDTIVKR